MYNNPYTDLSFFQFFPLLFSRVFALFSGKLSWGELATDEIQIIVLAIVGMTGALVGTFLVLRRMAMLANALSHTILLGIVIAYFVTPSLTIPVLMIAATCTGVATTLMTEFLNRTLKLQEDASIGLVFSLFFALGIVLLTLLSRNVHVGTELIMGNVDGLQRSDIKIVITILAINILLFFMLYYGFKITTFDPQLARIFGFSPLIFNYLLMVQTSATAMGAFKAVGVLMVLSFFVFPPLTARRLTHRLSHMIATAAALGALASLLGVALSRHILTFWGAGLSTGGIVVIILGVLYFTVVIINSLIDFTRRSLYNRFNLKFLRKNREKDEENCCIG
jgi:manganese/zinc/iron transport system permease protein